MEESGHFLQPLSSQRYFKAAEKAKELKAPFLIDLGCNECGFLFYLSRNPEYLQFALGADINLSAMSRGIKCFSFSNCSYIHSRDFKVGLLKEDITDFTESFIDQYKYCPYITILEVIEHIPIDKLNASANQIFKRLLPAAVFLTTPNFEYNKVLNNAYGDRKSSFRHPDHKFEWTRQQFAWWCEWICSTFNYSCVIDGIGKCFDVKDDVDNGFASHSVFFVRYPILERPFTFPESPLHSITVTVNADCDPRPAPEEEDTVSWECSESSSG